MKYTKPKKITIFTIIRPNNKIAITIQDKGTLVREYVFFQSPKFQAVEYQSTQWTTHFFITKNDVPKDSLYQSEKTH